MRHQEHLKAAVTALGSLPEQIAEEQAAEILDFIAARQASRARAALAWMATLPEEDEDISPEELAEIEAALADPSPPIPATQLYREAGWP